LVGLRMRRELGDRGEKEEEGETLVLWEERLVRKLRLMLEGGEEVLGGLMGWCW